MNQGRVEQIGTPREVYRSPATSFVADFLGDSLTVSVDLGEKSLRLARIGKDFLFAARPAGAARLLWRSDEVTIGPRTAEAVLGRFRSNPAGHRAHGRLLGNGPQAADTPPDG